MDNVTKSITNAYRMVQLGQRDFYTLNESEKSFLVENRIAHLKSTNPTIDTSHDALAKHKDAGDIIDHFATNADPTPNKVHTQHILKLYKAKNIRQEDHARIKKAYSDFDTYRPKLANKDINSYKKLGDIEDAVAPHVGSHVTKAAETKAIKTEGADKVYEDDNISIHAMKTHAAACHYGAGTKWCTASKDDPSMFEHYHKEGPLHVVIHKPSNEKFQFHAPTSSFMNAKDEEITPDEFKKIKSSFHKALEKNPSIAGADKL
jgi:hypothetical protein